MRQPGLSQIVLLLRSPAITAGRSPGAARAPRAGGEGEGRGGEQPPGTTGGEGRGPPPGRWGGGRPTPTAPPCIGEGRGRRRRGPGAAQKQTRGAADVDPPITR